MKKLSVGVNRFINITIKPLINIFLYIILGLSFACDRVLDIRGEDDREFFHIDLNNLYGQAQGSSLPTGNFKWCKNPEKFMKPSIWKKWGPDVSRYFLPNLRFSIFSLTLSILGWKRILAWGGHWGTAKASQKGWLQLISSSSWEESSNIS